MNGPDPLPLLKPTANYELNRAVSDGCQESSLDPFMLKRIVSSAAGYILFPTVILWLLSGCGRNNESSQLSTNAPEATVGESTQSEGGSDKQAEQEWKREMIAHWQKEREARERGDPLPPSMFRFPNTFDPEQPIPSYLNFYCINDRYPTYLLCEYRVEKRYYYQSDDAGYLKAALEQIRESGPTKFPPLDWVAVIIINRAEWNGADTFEQAHKVGAIFKARDVFSPSSDLSQSIAMAPKDRHPFMYDTTQPTPGEQQRWLIVERHAAAIGAATNSNEKAAEPEPHK